MIEQDLPKKAYSPPVLTKFGSVGSLTQGGSGGSAEPDNDPNSPCTQGNPNKFSNECLPTP